MTLDDYIWANNILDISTRESVKSAMERANLTVKDITLEDYLFLNIAMTLFKIDTILSYCPQVATKLEKYMSSKEV